MRLAARLPLRALFLCIWGIASSCGYLRSAAIGNLTEDVASASARHDDIELVAQAVPTFLVLLEGLLESDPQDDDLLLAAAEGYTAYAVLIEHEDASRARRLYRRARDYGWDGLVARRPALKGLREASFGEFARVERHLKEDDLPWVFWTASAWGGWVSTNLQSMPALAQLPRVIYMMEWVLEHDEGFQGGGPHVFLGVYYGALPRMLGGDPDRSLRHFDRAIDLSGGKDLSVLVQKARYYARQIFDRRLYEELLREVLERPVDAVPELTLQNAAAQRQARLLLDEIDEHF